MHNAIKMTSFQLLLEYTRPTELAHTIYIVIQCHVAASYALMRMLKASV